MSESAKPRRFLVTGARNWYCLDTAEKIVAIWVRRYDINFRVVHGDAPGVDSAFREACDRICRDFLHEPHPADWKRYGIAAGPIRNQEMVDRGADSCIAFHGDLANSKGTKDCVKRAIKAGIPTWLLTADYSSFTDLRQIHTTDPILK